MPKLVSYFLDWVREIPTSGLACDSVSFLIACNISSCLAASSSVLFFKAAVVVVMSAVFDSTLATWSASIYCFWFILCSTFMNIGSRLMPDLLSFMGVMGLDLREFNLERPLGSLLSGDRDRDPPDLRAY